MSGVELYLLIRFQQVVFASVLVPLPAPCDFVFHKALMMNHE